MPRKPPLNFTGINGRVKMEAENHILDQLDRIIKSADAEFSATGLASAYIRVEKFITTHERSPGIADWIDRNAT